MMRTALIVLSTLLAWAGPFSVAPASTTGSEQQTFTYDALGRLATITGASTQVARLNFLWREDFACGATVDVRFTSDTGRAIPARTFRLGPTSPVHFEELEFLPVRESPREAIVIDARVRVADPSCPSLGHETMHYSIELWDANSGATVGVFEAGLKSLERRRGSALRPGETRTSEEQVLSGGFGESATFKFALGGRDAERLACPLVGTLTIRSADGATPQQEHAFRLAPGSPLHLETLSFLPRGGPRESLIYSVSVGFDASCTTGGAPLLDGLDIDLATSVDVSDQGTQETVTICVGYSDNFLNA